MKNTLNKIEKHWKTKGYITHELYGRGNNDEVFEVIVKFSREDGKPVNFHEEWDALKKIGQTHKFYILPLEEVSVTGEKVATVQLVSRDLINLRFHKLNEVRDAIIESYWYLQNDELIVKAVEELVRSMITIKNTHAKIKNMKSASTGVIREYIQTDAVYSEWIKWKQELRGNYYKLLRSGKLTEHDLKTFKEFISVYE